jgi:hypothetical protein
VIALAWHFRKALLVLLLIGFAQAQWWPAGDRARAVDGIARSAWSYEASLAAQAPAPPLPIGPAGPGVVYAQAQLESALQGEGVAEPSAHVGGAVAEAESGGRSDAICDSCAGAIERSVGPWQINLLAHPWVSAACAMALACAAHAAAVISEGGRSWWAWTTYRTGAWRRFA